MLFIRTLKPETLHLGVIPVGAATCHMSHTGAEKPPKHKEKADQSKFPPAVVVSLTGRHIPTQKHTTACHS